MRKTAFVLLTLAVSLPATPTAFAVSKEIIQMQQQLDTLQHMVENLQKTVDTQTAVLRTLIEQANDNVNAMKSTVAALEKKDAENLASTGSRFDSVTTQMQALSESLEEAKARLAKLSDQLAQTQNMIQTISKPPQPVGASTAGPTASADANPRAAPDPDTLYKSGLTDYTTGRYDLAIQSFQEYLQYYGDRDLASNAQFYIGDSYYNQQKYDEAIQEYNKCLERYPNGNKLAAAQLKKAYALLALGKTQAGARELRSLIQRSPHSHEADLARQRLKKLGTATSRESDP